MKLTEKQKVKLAEFFEAFLFLCGIVFGLGILAFGISMIWTVMSSLFN